MRRKRNDLSRIVTMRDKAARKLETSRKEVEELEKELEAANIVLAKLSRNRIGRQTLRTSDASPRSNVLSAQGLHGMDQKQAMVALAKRNGGKVRIENIREVLERAGVMKRTKNSYKTLFQTAKKSGLFRKSARGEFELIEG